MIIFTNKVFHEARRKATQLASSLRITICLTRSCGVSTLCECLKKGKCL